MSAQEEAEGEGEAEEDADLEEERDCRKIITHSRYEVADVKPSAAKKN